MIRLAHAAQVWCPHGMNAVSRAASRQTGHSSVPLERSGAGSARGSGVGGGADSRAETPCDHSPPVALTRNEYAPPASSPLTRALLLLTVAKLCQAPPVLRHCTSKLIAEPCSHASVTSVSATLSILRPRSVRPAGAAAVGELSDPYSSMPLMQRPEEPQ